MSAARLLGEVRSARDRGEKRQAEVGRRVTDMVSRRVLGLMEVLKKASVL